MQHYDSDFYVKASSANSRDFEQIADLHLVLQLYPVFNTVHDRHHMTVQLAHNQGIALT